MWAFYCVDANFTLAERTYLCGRFFYNFFTFSSKFLDFFFDDIDKIDDKEYYECEKYKVNNLCNERSVFD